MYDFVVVNKVTPTLGGRFTVEIGLWKDPQWRPFGKSKPAKLVTSLKVFGSGDTWIHERNRMVVNSDRIVQAVCAASIELYLSVELDLIERA